MNIQLGDRIRDEVTGFEGIAVGLTDYLTGCTHVGIQARCDHDGKVPEWYWVDVRRCAVLQGGAFDLAAARGGSAATVVQGGPMPNPPSM